MSWLWVAVGGALGTLLRYALAVGTRRLWPEAATLATFTVNVVGSLLLGFILIWGAGRTIGGVDARLVLGTGAMGGFTTYSSFDLEALALMEAGHLGRAALYIGATILVCLASGALGLWLGRALV